PRAHSDAPPGTDDLFRRPLRGVHPISQYFPRRSSLDTTMTLTVERGPRDFFASGGMLAVLAGAGSLTLGWRATSIPSSALRRWSSSASIVGGRRAFACRVAAKGHGAFTGIDTRELAILKDRLHTIPRADAEATLRVLRQVSALFEEPAGCHSADTSASG